MKRQNVNQEDAAIVRQKAEEQLKIRKDVACNVSTNATETDILKLIHELEVHQIELEMQNEELLIAKEKAELEEEKYTGLYDFAPSGYLSLTKLGDIAELNFSAATMLGKERPKLIQKRFALFLSKETLAGFNHFLEKVFTSKIKQTCEAIIVTEVNLPIYVNIEGIVSKNSEFCLLTLTDITDLKKAEQIIQQQNTELQKLNAAKDRFIKILAHDLKNPFSSILGFSDLLIKNINKYDKDKIETQLKIINQTIHRTYHLLNDLLLWTNSQSGKLSFDPKPIYLNEICNEQIEHIKLHADTKSITLNFSGPETIKIFADVNMLKTVFRNLILNAVKFTNRNGQINIYAEKNDKTATITISDNGVGIELKNIPKLWDIAVKHSTTGTEGETGTGLGLLLCKEFVEKHDGKIWVESEVGKGSAFKFTIPLRND